MSKEIKCESENAITIKAAKELPRRLQEKHRGRIVIADDAVYLGRAKPIACVCTVCGYKWDTSPQSLLNGHGCPECSRLRRVALAGTMRKRRSSKALRELVIRMRDTGMSYRQIAAVVRRGYAVVSRWCDPELAAKERKRSLEKDLRDRASGHLQKRQAAYYQTEHGKATGLKNSHKRRSL